MSRQERLRAIGTRVGLLVGSLLFSLLLAEGAVRLFKPQVLAVPFQDYCEGISCVRANVSGSNNIPGLYRTSVHTNSQRFRGEREFEAAPSTKALRIAVLGDSFTWGVGASDDETYPAQLERVVTEGKPGRRVEVINAGVPGTGTGEQVRRYQQEVRKFGPRIVVLTMTYNDIDDDFNAGMFTLNQDGSVTPTPLAQVQQASGRLQQARRVSDRIPGYSFFVQHSHLANLARRVASVQLGREGADTSADRTASDTVEGVAIPRMKGEIRWLNSLVAADGARLVVCFFPSRPIIHGPSEADVEQATTAILGALRELNASDAILTCDGTPNLRLAAQTSNGEVYYKGMDVHPNPIGYRAMAMAVGSAVAQAGLAK